MIGEIFDKVYPEGALSNPVANVQTTHVPAGGATVVEFTARVPGTYAIVDHSLGRLEKGAAGQIVVDGADDPAIYQSITPGTAGSGGHWMKEPTMHIIQIETSHTPLTTDPRTSPPPRRSWCDRRAS